MPEKYRKKELHILEVCKYQFEVELSLKKSKQPADVRWRGRSVSHK